MTVNYDDLPREKLLTPEELEKQIERLTAPRVQPEVRDPFEVCPTKHISGDQLARMTDRLYTQSLERKAASLAAAEQAAYGAKGRGGKGAAAGESVKLTPEAEERAVDRLYTGSLQRREANMEQLRKQYQYHPASGKKKVPLNTFVQHMYTDRIEAKKKTAQHLHDLYIAPTEIRTATISRAEAAESANRLSATKS